MKAFLSELLTSKKFVAAAGAVVTVVAVKVAGKLGIVVDNESASQISGLVALIASAYCVSQGIADHGKEAAQVNADAAKAARS